MADSKEIRHGSQYGFWLLGNVLLQLNLMKREDFGPLIFIAYLCADCGIDNLALIGWLPQ